MYEMSTAEIFTVISEYKARSVLLLLDKNNIALIRNVISRCNYSIYLIVRQLRFKSTKLIFTRVTPPILTISALLKHPFFTDCKYNDFLCFLYLDESLNYILTCGYQWVSGAVVKDSRRSISDVLLTSATVMVEKKVRENHGRITIDCISGIIGILSVAAYGWTNSTNLVENYNMQIFKGI